MNIRKSKHPAAAQVLYGLDNLGWTPEMCSSSLEVPLSEVNEIIATERGVTFVVENLDNDSNVLAAIKQLATQSSSDKVRMDALKYIHAEKTGRNDIPAEQLKLQRAKLRLEATNVGLNIQRFNEALKRARSSISVETTPSHDVIEA